MQLKIVDAGKDALRQTLVQLRATPQSLELHKWATTTIPFGDFAILIRTHELLAARAGELACTTVCCIAGWIVYFGATELHAPLRIEESAIHVLFGNEIRHFPFSFPLFHPSSWHSLPQWQDTADQSAENVARNLEQILNDGFLEVTQDTLYDKSNSART